MTPLTTTLSLASAVVGTCTAATWVSMSPRNCLWGRVHSRGRTDTAQYALTFDDGPTPGPTDAVLDELGELGVKATFFVIGQNARRHPDVLARIHREGHIVANHSFDHDHFTLFRGPRYWNRQLRQTDEIIQQVIGKKSAMFRPPLGIKTLRTMGAAHRAGHAVIAWAHGARDGVMTTQPQILERLTPHTRAGDVLLLHDGIEPHARPRDPSATIAAIRPLISQLRDRGLQPAPLDQLLQLPSYAPESATAAAATSSRQM